MNQETRETGIVKHPYRSKLPVSKRTGKVSLGAVARKYGLGVFVAAGLLAMLGVFFVTFLPIAVPVAIFLIFSAILRRTHELMKLVYQAVMDSGAKGGSS